MTTDRMAATGRRQVLARGLGLLLAAAVVPVMGGAAAPRVIPMRARRFVFIPDKLALKPGETVVLAITAEDVIMGFSAPDFGVRADLPPGQKVEVRLTAPKKRGSYAFLCDIFCGSGHESMGGTIDVA
ncbi:MULTISPECIES: cupredoxin domain-containing protein [unclassified Cupriavidus]|uniref:cupredoxin domain-containing protein n=1 Tax=unclassified Cupriavidus TaxID=2640874 RepID=UPI001CEC656D|nr:MULTISPECIES: cupredoxin domain-containing protein [unclassified Cupriavidus]